MLARFSFWGHPHSSQLISILVSIISWSALSVSSRSPFLHQFLSKSSSDFVYHRSVLSLSCPGQVFAGLIRFHFLTIHIILKWSFRCQRVHQFGQSSSSYRPHFQFFQKGMKASQDSYQFHFQFVPGSQTAWHRRHRPMRLARRAPPCWSAAGTGVEPWYGLHPSLEQLVSPGVRSKRPSIIFEFLHAFFHLFHKRTPARPVQPFDCSAHLFGMESIFNETGYSTCQNYKLLNSANCFFPLPSFKFPADGFLRIRACSRFFSWFWWKSIQAANPQFINGGGPGVLYIRRWCGFLEQLICWDPGYKAIR